jgi:hypothetical protein
MEKSAMKRLPLGLRLGLVVLLALGASGCATNRPIMIYGFGKQAVPRDATVDDINQMIRDQYGTDLFWTR